MQGMSNIEPRLQTGCAQPYVAILVQITLHELGKANALVNEVMEWLSHKDVKIAGPLFYRYYAIGDMEKPFSIEVGFPVSAFVEGDDRVITGHIPDGTFATLVHCGHPDKLAQSFETLQNWAEAQGIRWKKYTQNNEEVWAGRFEFYMTNPADEPDLNKWRTAIAVLIEE